MADLPHIEDDDRDDEKLTEIVSYLDGELDDTQMVQMEQELIKDPDLRSHADILSRTWAMLDELDEVSASKRFTQETLATISAEATKPDEAPQRHMMRSFAAWLSIYKLVPCFLLGLVGGVCGLTIADGFTESRQKRPDVRTNQLLLDNYDLLQRLDSYLLVPDAASLQKLRFPPDDSQSEDGEEP